MAGKMCNGFGNNNAFLPGESKAYCEGMKARYEGISVNPYPDPSPYRDCWQTAWNHVDGRVGSVIPASEMACCAVPTTTVPV